ncbi:MAG: sensor histidine kinase, partial [Opitutaceae bacterium]
MSYLIIAALALAFLWLGRRHIQLQRGVRLLAESVRRRRPFLEEDETLRILHSSWSELAAETSALITDLGRLSHQQADQLTQLETTLGNLQEAVLIVDRDNYILLANAALQKMFPSAAGMPGRRLESVLRSAEFLDYLEAVRAERNVPQTDIGFLSEGRTIWLEITGALVPDTTKRKGPWVLFVLHDVTRQRHLENVRREFVANVSHELKTPLSVIKGYAETIVDDHGILPPDQLHQFAGAIHRHSERLSAIVEDLLTLSKLEDDPSAAAADLDRIRLVALLESVREDFAEAVEKGGHPFALVLPQQDCELEVDPLRIHQVFANLIENARKYTPRASKIELGGAVRDGRAELWVRDEGPGIPVADLPRIFERFYRVEKGRSRETGGTGLGLSIVKHIAQMHHGQVWAESEPGRGLRVVFALPVLPSVSGELPLPPAVD